MLVEGRKIDHDTVLFIYLFIIFVDSLLLAFHSPSVSLQS